MSEHAPVAALRKLRDSHDADGISRELWKGFAEMGFTGMLVPEEHGGLGLGHTVLWSGGTDTSQLTVIDCTIDHNQALGGVGGAGASVGASAPSISGSPIQVTLPT